MSVPNIAFIGSIVAVWPTLAHIGPLIVAGNPVGMTDNSPPALSVEMSFSLSAGTTVGKTCEKCFFSVEQRARKACGLVFTFSVDHLCSKAKRNWRIEYLCDCFSVGFESILNSKRTFRFSPAPDFAPSRSVYIFSRQKHVESANARHARFGRNILVEEDRDFAEFKHGETIEQVGAWFSVSKFARLTLVPIIAGRVV